MRAPPFPLPLSPSGRGDGRRGEAARTGPHELGLGPPGPVAESCPRVASAHLSACRPPGTGPWQACFESIAFRKQLLQARGRLPLHWRLREAAAGLKITVSAGAPPRRARKGGAWGLRGRRGAGTARCCCCFCYRHCGGGSQEGFPGRKHSQNEPVVADGTVLVFPIPLQVAAPGCLCNGQREASLIPALNY